MKEKIKKKQRFEFRPNLYLKLMWGLHFLLSVSLALVTNIGPHKGLNYSEALESGTGSFFLTTPEAKFRMTLSVSYAVSACTEE
jgi:hypothetical protein